MSTRKFCDIDGAQINGDYLTILCTTEAGMRELTDACLSCGITEVLTKKMQAVQDGYLKEVTIRRERWL